MLCWECEWDPKESFKSIITPRLLREGSRTQSLMGCARTPLETEVYYE